MLIRLSDVTTINARQIMSCMIITVTIPAVTKGFFRKKVVTPETHKFNVTVKYTCGIEYTNFANNTIKTITWEFDKFVEAEKHAKKLNDVFASLDDEYVTRAFEREVLK